jgi:trans-aconitate methyltransferase
MNSFLNDCKQMIEKDNLEGLQEYYAEYSHENFPWDYIYQKLYLHACLKKKQRIVDWLKSLYSSFDPIQQIALRQMFSYGKYLLAK